MLAILKENKANYNYIVGKLNNVDFELKLLVSSIS